MHCPNDLPSVAAHSPASPESTWAAVGSSARETYPSNSADISVLFGYFPAQRAARMNPIKALRHE
jgi:tRNA nucleotidyltransferase (CCA-adding enzyme)